MALIASKWIKLNVDGRLFQTTLSTLMSSPDSLLAKMFDPESGFQPPHSEDGVYFLNEDPVYFGVILNWLRYRRVLLAPGTDLVSLAHIADYFGIVELVEAAEAMENNNKQEIPPVPPLAQWITLNNGTADNEVQAMWLSLVTSMGPCARIIQLEDTKLSVIMTDSDFNRDAKCLTLEGEGRHVWVPTVAGKLPPGAIAFEGERGEKLHVGRRLWVTDGEKKDAVRSLQVFLTEERGGGAVLPEKANISLGYVNEDGVWDINFTESVNSILQRSYEDPDMRDIGRSYEEIRMEVFIENGIVCTTSHFEVLCTF